MKLKKIILLLLSMFLLFGAVSCTQPASQPVKEEEQEEDEEISIVDIKVMEKFPELKEIRDYLLDHYPLSREAQEKEERLERGSGKFPPIGFSYEHNLEGISRVEVSLNFPPSVTKKQMVEALTYVMEKLKELYPEDENISLVSSAEVCYTEDGRYVYEKEMYKQREFINVSYKKNRKLDERINPPSKGDKTPDTEWTISTETGEMIPFDPSSVKEGEKPKILGGVGEASELKAYLNSIGVEEFSFEQGNGIYTSTGIDPTETYGYTAIIRSDKETVQEIVYTVTKKENVTDDEYLELCKTYLITGATFGYVGVNKDEVTNFIEDNIETVITTGMAKAQTIGTLSFMITYVNNTASLIILNPNEQYDPSSVKEGEKPQYIVENPTEPEQQPEEEAPKEEPAPAPTGLGGVKLSELKDYLSSADVEEFSFEEGNGIYTSTGIDPTKTYGYTAVTGSDKETLQGVVYMITKKENLTNDEYLELCEMYLTAGATFGYEGVDADEVTSFIENNMETILSTGEPKSQMFGNFSFTITYADNTASLIILNPNEQ